ncbi:MAG: cytochrome c oxidase subunit II [Candidatus Eisenbacteria bacterium]|nr:cytochrome c oxidase subunit II [Candidatus Eisenbacteria bacterium]
MSTHEFHSAVVAPQGIWWAPTGRQEKTWIAIAFAWCLVLFAMMPFWHFKGGQNPSGIRYRVTPEAYEARVERFVNEYKIGEESGIPIVEPPPGADVYLVGRQWQWYPALKLKKGVQYTLHLSASDVNHGFSLYPVNLNFQVLPGYDYGLRVVPNRAGDFRIICNEFCGIGHHLMVGKVLVVE